MPKIYFKCKACTKHLVVDESRRDLPIACPDCQAVTTIPTGLSVHQCPRCGQRLMIAAEMNGALLHCASCQEPIRAPGLSHDPGTGETTVFLECPQCHANVTVTEEISNRPTPCPSCGEQVYFRDTLGFKGSQNAGPPKPKPHDELRFRRRFR